MHPGADCDVHEPVNALWTIFIKLTAGLVTHKLFILPVKAAVLNCETSNVPVLVATHVKTPYEYVNELTPIEAKVGVKIPETEPITRELDPTKVPPEGLAFIVIGDPVLQSGGIIEKIGVEGFATTILIVFVIGQLAIVGVTTTV